MEDILINQIVFCCIWSIGAAIEETSRKKFSEFYVHLFNGAPDLMAANKIDPDY